MIAILVKLLASPILGSIAGFLGSWLTKMEERSYNVHIKHNCNLRISGD